MAYYKYQQAVSLNQNAAFDVLHSPGDITPNSGIYRCAGCGHEMVSVAGHRMPPQNHHQHSVAQGQIRWQLAVMSTHA